MEQNSLREKLMDLQLVLKTKDIDEERLRNEVTTLKSDLQTRNNAIDNLKSELFFQENRNMEEEKIQREKINRLKNENYSFKKNFKKLEIEIERLRSVEYK